MRLIQRGILGSGAFDDVGRPTGVYQNHERKLLAVAGYFGGYQWHGRDVGDGRRLTYRVSVYETATLNRVAFLDRVRYPINQIAFHPQRPLLVIAAGSYDGGYGYGGELYFWNFATGESATLLDAQREVITCHFDDEIDDLHLTVRPPIDEDYWDAERRQNIRPQDAEIVPRRPTFSMRLDMTLPAAAWRGLRDRSVDLDALPTHFRQVKDLTEGYAHQPEEEVCAALATLARAAGQHYTPRWDVWDLAWVPDGRILATRNATALECWTPDGVLDWYLPDAMNGVQILPTPDSKHAYVSLWRGFKPRSEPGATTRIERITLHTGEAITISEVDVPVILSISARGDLLAREAGREWRRREGPTRDRIITSELAVSAPLDLGGYDPNNHYLRIDGAAQLYFLQGTPPRTSMDQWVCRIESRTLRVERLFPLEWDEKRNGHLLSGAGCYVRDERGKALILAGTVHRPEKSHFIVRRVLGDGAASWAVPCESQVTALVYLPQSQVVAFALTDGQMGIIEARTGMVLERQRVVIGGCAALPISLAGRENQLAVGLVDGRIALYKWDK